jgi:hypothetical protein
VKLWLIILIVLGANALAAVLMLYLRRRAPAEGHFRDSQHASGALTVTGTVYAVLVGFVFLLAFQSYESARSSSQEEAVATLGLFHIAEQLPVALRDDIQGGVTCYARAVIRTEWPAMAEEQSSPVVERWTSRVERDFERARLHGEVQSAAEQSWFSETDQLQTGRRGRLAESTHFVPTAIWVLLIAGGAVVVAFVFLFADSRERRLSQWMMITAVTTAVTASLLMVAYLNQPYGNHQGAIVPSSMHDVLTTMDREQGAQQSGAAPCDATGHPS